MPQFGVTCRTAQPRAPDDPGKCTSIVQGFLFDGRSPADIKRSCQIEKAHKDVGELIANGQCDQALRAALATGDFAFATQVRQFCPSGAPATTADAQR